MLTDCVDLLCVKNYRQISSVDEAGTLHDGKE